MKTIKDYYTLHLDCDVLLLADVSEEYRNNSLKHYGLCPSHYLSAQALSCDAMLCMTKVKLELISDTDMYLFFGKGMRGIVFYISKRFSKANNKYLKPYKPKQEPRHIVYLDANNLHDYGMPKYLPTNEFKWIDPKELDLNRYTSNSSKGCV